MNLLNSSYTIEDQKEFDLRGIKKFIEKCARVCYKSESKITEDSYEKFVGNLIKKGHMRPLEFGTVYLFIPIGDAETYKDVVDFYKNNKWSKCFDYTDTNKNGKIAQGYYITTNYRVIIENNVEYHLKFLCDPKKCHSIRHTVHFILSRGCMDDFRTHITLSHLGESTRYCNYTNEKFGGITYIIPQWCNNIMPVEDIESTSDFKKYIQEHKCSPEEIILLKAFSIASLSYKTLVALGKIPQESREVLPMGIKSELISCGFEDAWDNFFSRRNAPDAQKEAQHLAKYLSMDFNDRGWYNPTQCA